MIPVFFHPKASIELEAAATYYEKRQSGLGKSFLAETRKAHIRISELPNAALEIRPGIRRRSIHRFPYYVVYAISTENIAVIAVAHKRRRPDFWVGRV